MSERLAWEILALSGWCKSDFLLINRTKQDLNLKTLERSKGLVVWVINQNNLLNSGLAVEFVDASRIGQFEHLPSSLIDIQPNNQGDIFRLQQESQNCRCSSRDQELLRSLFVNFGTVDRGRGGISLHWLLHSLLRQAGAQDESHYCNQPHYVSHVYLSLDRADPEIDKSRWYIWPCIISMQSAKSLLALLADLSSWDSNKASHYPYREVAISSNIWTLKCKGLKCDNI
jgi:hypothetical protein